MSEQATIDGCIGVESYPDVEMDDDLDLFVPLEIKHEEKSSNAAAVADKLIEQQNQSSVEQVKDTIYDVDPNPEPQIAANPYIKIDAEIPITWSQSSLKNETKIEPTHSAESMDTTETEVPQSPAETNKNVSDAESEDENATHHCYPEIVSYLTKDPPMVKCLPYCRSNCVVKHHPLLVALLNCVDTTGEVQMDERLDSLQEVISKYQKSGKWSLDDPIPDATEAYHYPIIHWACALGRVAASIWLVGHGVNPATCAKNKGGVTGLHRAQECLPETCADVAVNKFKQLLSVMDLALFEGDEDGNSPVHYCCIMLRHHLPLTEYYMAFLQLMIMQAENSFPERVAEILDMQNNDGDTALHILACNDYNYDMMQLLVSSGASHNIRNKKRVLPVDIATSNNALFMKEGLTVMQMDQDDAEKAAKRLAPNETEKKGASHHIQSNVRKHSPPKTQISGDGEKKSILIKKEDGASKPVKRVVFRSGTGKEEEKSDTKWYHPKVESFPDSPSRECVKQDMAAPFTQLPTIVSKVSANQVARHLFKDETMEVEVETAGEGESETTDNVEDGEGTTTVVVMEPNEPGDESVTVEEVSMGTDGDMKIKLRPSKPPTEPVCDVQDGIEYVRVTLSMKDIITPRSSTVIAGRKADTTVTSSTINEPVCSYGVTSALEDEIRKQQEAWNDDGVDVTGMNGMDASEYVSTLRTKVHAQLLAESGSQRKGGSGSDRDSRSPNPDTSELWPKSSDILDSIGFENIRPYLGGCTSETRAKIVAAIYSDYEKHQTKMEGYLEKEQEDDVQRLQLLEEQNVQVTQLQNLVEEMNRLENEKKDMQAEVNLLSASIMGYSDTKRQAQKKLGSIEAAIIVLQQLETNSQEA